MITVIDISYPSFLKFFTNRCKELSKDQLVKRMEAAKEDLIRRIEEARAEYCPKFCFTADMWPSSSSDDSDEGGQNPSEETPAAG